MKEYDLVVVIGDNLDPDTVQQIKDKLSQNKQCLIIGDNSSKADLDLVQKSFEEGDRAKEVIIFAHGIIANALDIDPNQLNSIIYKN